MLAKAKTGTGTPSYGLHALKRTLHTLKRDLHTLKRALHVSDRQECKYIGTATYVF